MRQSTEKGFFLIELLLLVAIIALIPYTTLFRSLASRRAANEGSAEQSLRTISSAEATYQNTAGNGTYGTLTFLMNQSLVDSVLGGATASATAKSGYIFTVTPVVGPPAQFWAYAL